MTKTLILLGASIITHGLMFSGAEARLVRYEINGKQYSYSTNNRAQTAEAKRRIAAAKAAEAAKAKAEAERAKNPLKAVFGSAAQREAKEAEERLQKILAEPQSEPKTEYMAVSLPVRDRVAETETKSRDKRARRTAPAKPTPKPVERPVEVVRAPARPMLASAAPALPLVIAEPVSQQELDTKVKSVSFDMQTGIKTTIMVDGTIEEEPFDSSALAYLAPEWERSNSLTAFVNQMRKMMPEETTGSIRTSEAAPEDTSVIRHR